MTYSISISPDAVSKLGIQTLRSISCTRKGFIVVVESIIAAGSEATTTANGNLKAVFHKPAKDCSILVDRLLRILRGPKIFMIEQIIEPSVRSDIGSTARLIINLYRGEVRPDDVIIVYFYNDKPICIEHSWATGEWTYSLR